MRVKRPIQAVCALLLGVIAAEGITRAVFMVPGVQQQIYSLGARGSVLLYKIRADFNQDFLGTHGDGPLVYNATRGWTNRPGSNYGHGYGHIIEGGIRRHRPLPKADANKRVVILGDSFAYGYGVADSEVIDAQLEAMLPNATVINLAVPGYSHEQILLSWRTQGMHLHPDAVLIVLVSVDNSRNGFIATDYLKPWASLDDSKLVFHGIPVPSPQQVYNDTYWESRMWQVFQALRPAPSTAFQGPLSRALVSTLVREVASTTPAIALIAPIPGEYQDDNHSAPLLFRDAACDKAICVDGDPAVQRVLASGDSGVAENHWSAALIHELALDVAPAIRDALGKPSTTQEAP